MTVVIYVVYFCTSECIGYLYKRIIYVILRCCHSGRLCPTTAQLTYFDVILNVCFDKSRSVCYSLFPPKRMISCSLRKIVVEVEHKARHVRVVRQIDGSQPEPGVRDFVLVQSQTHLQHPALELPRVAVGVRVEHEVPLQDPFQGVLRAHLSQGKFYFTLF